MLSNNSFNFLLNKALLFSLILLLCLGIFFRFANLESKIFWVDEVSTLVRVSGYTVPEVNQDLAAKDIVKKSDLLAYQKFGLDKNFSDSLAAFKQSPEHAPLYFLLARGWLKLWGNSITTVRSLSVFLSLLIFPCLYWLCQELFNKPAISSLAVVLMSVSPFYVAYAQEARPYSLWTTAILLMGASFIRAVRVNNKASWLLYSLSLIIGFYTSLLSIYIGLFFSIYLCFASFKHKWQIIKSCSISSLISLLVFAPWILVILQNIELLDSNTSWMRTSLNLADIVAVFVGTILLIFGDLPISDTADPIQIAIALIAIILILLVTSFVWLKIPYLVQKDRFKQSAIQTTLVFIVGLGLMLSINYIKSDIVTLIGALIAICILSLASYSLYFLIATTHYNVWLFVVCLMLSVPVPLVLSDIINQGQSSATPRYLIPFQLAIQIAASYTLGSKLFTLPKLSFKSKKLWQLVTIMFISLGVFSCIRNMNISPIYQKSRNVNNTAIAYVINQKSQPLLIAEANEAMDILSLAYSLSSETSFRVIKDESEIAKYLNDFDSIFLLKPSVELKNKLQQNPNIKITKVYQPRLYSADAIALDLWSIEQL